MTIHIGRKKFFLKNLINQIKFVIITYYKRSHDGFTNDASGYSNPSSAKYADQVYNNYKQLLLI